MLHSLSVCKRCCENSCFAVNKKEMPDIFLCRALFYSTDSLYNLLLHRLVIPSVSYLMMLAKSLLVKYLANSKSVAAFLANVESLATALFKLLITIEELLVLAPRTAVR